MAVKTILHAVALDRFRALLGCRDEALRVRLEERWFGSRRIAEKEREPDRAMMHALIHEGELYGEFDDETALRMDKMVMLLMEHEAGAVEEPVSFARDDLQLLVRSLRAHGRDPGVAPLLDHLCNGRRLGSSTLPIDVPHYAFLEEPELRRFDAAAAGLAAPAGRGVLGRLFGSAPALKDDEKARLEQLRRAFAAITARGLDLFSVNRDPTARFDMA